MLSAQFELASKNKLASTYSDFSTSILRQWFIDRFGNQCRIRRPSTGSGIEQRPCSSSHSLMGNTNTFKKNASESVIKAIMPIQLWNVIMYKFVFQRASQANLL